MAATPPHPPVPKPRSSKPHPAPPPRPPPPNLQRKEESGTRTSPQSMPLDSQSKGPSQPHPQPQQEISITPEDDCTASDSSPPLGFQDYEDPVSISGRNPAPASLNSDHYDLGYSPTPPTQTPNSVTVESKTMGEGEEGEEEEGEEEGSDEEHPYADIDKTQRRHSDYANVDYPWSDSDDENDEGGESSSTRTPRGPKYAPSVKLDRHPLLKKSVSNSEVDSPHPSMAELMKAAAKKPKNRAPPPPPGGSKSPGGAKLSPGKGMAVVTKHKRSQSDIHSERSRDQRSKGGGQRSPIPEHLVSPQSHRVAPLPPTSSSQDRKPSAPSQRPASMPASQHSPKVTPSQDKLTPQTGQTRPHPVSGRVAPPPGPHRAAPGRPPPSGGGGKAKPKSSVPSHPPPPSGPAPSGPRTKGAPGVQSRHVNAWGEEKGAGQPRLHTPPDQDKSRDQEASPSNKPKRHAPPPPAGGALRKTPTNSPEPRRRKKEPAPPAYAEVMKGWKTRGPPKPKRIHRTRSLEGLNNLSEAQGAQEDTVLSPGDAFEEILRTMDLFTIELRKDGTQNTGISLVNGRIRSGRGIMAEGVFVEEVAADSPADLDGRVQAGDMLVELYGHIIRGNFEEAVELLEMPSGSVRLKVGRPDITSSVFSVHGAHEEPLYVNQNQVVGPDQVAEVVVDLQEKLERTRLKAQEFERDKELTVKQMDLLKEEFEKEKELAAKQLEELKEMAEKEKEALKKEAQELRESFDQYRKDSEGKTSELSLTLASVTVSKTKAENDLECHKETLESLKLQLEEEKSKAREELKAIKKNLMDTEDKLKTQDSVKTRDFESKLKELQTELTRQKEAGAKMTTELTGEKKRVAELEERLKVAESDVKVEKALNDRLQQTIDNQALQISKLKLEVERLQRDLEDANAEVSSTAREPLLQAKPPRPLPTSSPKTPERTPSPPLQPPSSSPDHRPVSALSEEDIRIHENGEVSSDDEQDREDDAFDKTVPSPAAPCPYIDFVPLSLDDKASEKRNAAKEAESSKKVEPGGGIVPEGEEVVGKDGDVGVASEKAAPLPAEGTLDGDGAEEERKETAQEEKKEEKKEEEKEGKEDSAEAPAGTTFDIIINSPGDVTTTDGKGEAETADVSTTEEADAVKGNKVEEEEEEEEEKASPPAPAKEEDEDVASVPPEVPTLSGETGEGKGEEGEVAGESAKVTPDEVVAKDVSAEPTPVVVAKEESAEPTKESEVVTKEDTEDPLDAIKPHRKLDTSMAIYRSRVGGTIKRKLPSKAHLRKMGSSGDILENVPKELLSNLDTPLEDGSQESQLRRSASVDDKLDASSPPAPQPKPRPRAAPRKKQQPSPDEGAEGKKTPQAAPRMRAQTADFSEALKSPSKVTGSSSGDEKSDESPKQPVVNGVEKLSPIKAPKPSPSARPPHIGPKPSPKPHAKPPAKDPTGDATEDLIAPSRSRTSSAEKEPATSEVDPSKLSVKEKALLAQKALMATPEKAPKPGPPRVARKPKTPNPGTPVLGPETTEEDASVGSRMRRAQSVEDEIGESPQTKKKLPPGAINMFRMGAVPMFGPAPDRGRSATVSTSDPIARERNSLERRGVSPNPEIPEGEEEPDAPTEAPSTERSPFHAAPSKPSPNDSEAELLEDSESPQAPPKFEHKDTVPTADEGVELAAEVDYDCVLTWTPEVTAAWLGKVGLPSHGQAFVDKGIHGYLLFDLDGSKQLKGLGVVSHDDRAIFKKEIKNLRPFADKQKKLLEKQRKEDKKNAKKKKK